MRRKMVRNSDICYRDRVAILMAYKEEHDNTYAAAQAMGISASQAYWLNKLADAPKKIQEAIDRYDRTGKGLAFSAWREMADWPDWLQIIQLESGRTKTPEIKADGLLYQAVRHD